VLGYSALKRVSQPFAVGMNLVEAV